MRLDRLLDSVALDVRPFAICDVRRGVRIALALPEAAHVYYVLRGDGVLQAAAGFEAALSPTTLAIVPTGVAHGFEPAGGSTRLLSIQPVGTSDHVPTVIAGAGKPGLLLACSHVDVAHRGRPALFENLTAPLVLDLADTSYAPALFAGLLAEQEACLPGNRRMTKLLMQQCLVHVLRGLSWLWEPDDADYVRSTHATAVELKAPRSAQ